MQEKTRIMNHVILAPGVPARMHFTDHTWESRPITDPVTKLPKTVRALVFHVDEVDGVKTDAYYSTISDKHAMDFDPYLATKSYTGFTFEVTKIGTGFATSYKVMPVRRG